MDFPYKKETLPKLRSQLKTWKQMRERFAALGFPPGYPQGEFDHRIAELEHKIKQKEEQGK